MSAALDISTKYSSTLLTAHQLSMDSRHSKHWICFRIEGPDESAANALTAYPITRSAAR